MLSEGIEPLRPATTLIGNGQLVYSQPCRTDSDGTDVVQQFILFERTIRNNCPFSVQETSVR